MRRWRSKSWSEQARVKADTIYMNYIMYNTTYAYFLVDTLEWVEIGGESGAVLALANSYRAPIIRYRAAKRLGRLIRKKSKVGKN